MKKSLKTLTATFGIAGLVILTGCGEATDVTKEPLDQAVEVVEQKAGDMMDSTLEAGKDAMEGTDQALEKAMDKTAETGDAMMDKVTETGEDIMDKNTEMMKKQEVMDGEAMEKTDETIGDDGTKNLDVSYRSPAGAETIAVSMTITGGKVSEIIATPEAVESVSIKHQAAFAEAVSAKVVGKSIAEIADIDAIGGSSLTTGGFKAAVAAL